MVSLSAVKEKLIAIVAYQVFDAQLHQITEMLGENELMGEIAEKSDLMRSMKMNDAIENCKLAFKITSEEKPIIVVSKADTECYYKIDGEIEIKDKTRLMLGDSLIKASHKNDIWYIKTSNTNMIPKTTNEYQLNPKLHYNIGRLQKDSEDHITLLGDTDISRRHCKLWFEDGKWKLKDLGSLNGTYARLMVGEEIRINWEQELRVGIDLYLYFTTEEICDSCK